MDAKTYLPKESVAMKSFATISMRWSFTRRVFGIVDTRVLLVGLPSGLSDMELVRRPYRTSETGAQDIAVIDTTT
jgi:hypothetical protein